MASAALCQTIDKLEARLETNDTKINDLEAQISEYKRSEVQQCERIARLDATNINLRNEQSASSCVVTQLHETVAQNQVLKDKLDTTASERAKNISDANAMMIKFEALQGEKENLQVNFAPNPANMT